MQQHSQPSNSISLKGLILFYEYLLKHNKIKIKEQGAYKRYKDLKVWYAQRDLKRRLYVKQR